MRIPMLAAFALAILLARPAWASEPFRMAYIENYPPLSWMRDGSPAGVTVSILREALQTRMGLPVVHTLFPWKRAQQLVREGSQDALITQPTPQRREYGLISDVKIMSIDYTLFVSRDNPRIDALRKVRGLADLSPFRLGQLRGSQWAERNLTGLNVEWVTSIDQNLKKLAAGRIDGFIGNAYVMPLVVEEAGLGEQIVSVPEALLREIPYHLIVSKRSRFTDVLERFDETIRQMKADGTIERIIQAHVASGR